MPCSTFPEAVVDICHPCPHSGVMSELPRHRCVSINNHWRAMPTTLDEAPAFFRSFYTFSFSLLWKVNKLYRYLFYLINSHSLIHRVVKKNASSYPVWLLCHQTIYISPKSSIPRAEDGVIISHLILQITPLSQSVEMASREDWLQNLNKLHREKELNQISGVDWQHIW